MQAGRVKSVMKSKLTFVLVFFAAMQFWPTAVHSQGQAQNITCKNGSGQYSTKFSTGTTVSVSPLRSRGFSKRACAAKLIWNGQETSVASDAAKIGIDVLGADLGFGEPVVAFQIDETGEGTHLSYRILSLKKPPRLLYTIAGADSYSAADTDLDGKVEIWTNDAAVIDGFEKVPRFCPYRGAAIRKKAHGRRKLRIPGVLRHSNCRPSHADRSTRPRRVQEQRRRPLVEYPPPKR